MIPKERYLARLRGETPGIVPHIPTLMQFAAEYIGSNYGAFASDHRVLVEANLRCAEQFGFDHMVDMPAAREAFPGVVLAGNHDPVADVLHGTPESIRQLTLDCRQAAGSRFMVNAGCEIPSGTPNANLKALCEPLPCG